MNPSAFNGFLKLDYQTWRKHEIFLGVTLNLRENATRGKRLSNLAKKHRHKVQSPFQKTIMSKNRSTFIDTQRVKACCQNPPSSSAVSISHSTKQLKQQTVHTKPLTKVEIYCSLACKFNALLFDRKAASNGDPLSFLCYHSMKLKSRHSELPILTFYQFPSKLDIFGYGQ